MADWFVDFTSARWWVSVFVVGIVINFVSAKLLAKYDARMRKLSGWWADRSASKAAERAALIREVRASPRLQLYYATREGRARFLITILIATIIYVRVSEHSTAWLGNLASSVSPAAPKIAYTLFAAFVTMSLMFTGKMFLDSGTVLNEALLGDDDQ